MKNYSGIFVVILAVVAVLVFFNINNSPAYDFTDSTISLPEPNPGTDTDSESKPDSGSDLDNQAVSASYGTYYNQLTDYQKKIYAALLPVISEAKEEITLKNVNVSEFKNNCKRATVAIQYDHPEYFWFTGGYTLYSSYLKLAETGKVTIEPIYYDYVSTLFDSKSKSSELNSAVKSLASLARAHSSVDYERMIFVHDYLVENARYDKDALNEYYKTVHAPSCEYIFSAYGCLVNGKTVCSGYAKAFQLVMQELGYECYYITGNAGEAHGWNYVYIEGEGYYVDITWDDYDFDNEEPVYNYAFITGDALARTHTVDTEYTVPDCNGTEYNYYHYYGYYDAEYDFETAEKILSSQKDNSAQHIQFGSLEELEKAYEDLVQNHKIYEILGTDKTLRLSRNKNHYTLVFLQ